MAGKRYADTVSLPPRVSVDELGVIDVAGLMRQIVVADAVTQAAAERDKDEGRSDDAPNGAAKASD